MPTVFAYYAALALFKSWRSLLFFISVDKHFVYTLLSFFTSALTGSSINYVSVFKGTTTVAEPVVLLPLPREVHDFVADF